MNETNTTGTSKHQDNGLDPTITTFTGIHFNILEPEFDIQDIAHALSNTCRYAGHCKLFYSVAEHSVLVSRLMEELGLGDPMVGLMHDAHEAYLSDVPSPFKQLLPDWSKLDKELEQKVYEHFDLSTEHGTGMKEADVMAYFIERIALFKDWNTNLPYLARKYPKYQKRALVLIEEGWDIHAYDPYHAKRKFLKRYDELQKLS